MLDRKAFEPRRKAVELQWRIPTSQLSFLLSQPLRPVRILGFRSNPSEAKLPSDQKRILLAVEAFTAQRGRILAPRRHHGFTKPIGDRLAKLPLDEPPVPSRRPAFPTRTLNCL